MTQKSLHHMNLTYYLISIFYCVHFDLFSSFRCCWFFFYTYLLDEDIHLRSYLRTNHNATRKKRAAYSQTTLLFMGFHLRARLSPNISVMRSHLCCVPGNLIVFERRKKCLKQSTFFQKRNGEREFITRKYFIPF